MKIAVIGSGTMGHGIAQICSMAGYEVYLNDVKKEILDTAISKIRWSLDKLVERKKITEKQRDETLSRIKTTVDLKESVRNADFVFESVFEDVDLKKRIFRDLDEYAPSHTILGSNTSTIPITIIGEATNRPGQVIGAHFFNPPVLQPLMEIIPGEKTSKETIIATEQLARKLGKEPVILKRDPWGFVSSALFEHLLRESAWMVYEGEATPAEIDACARYKLGHPMGPLETIDLSGIDISYHTEFGVRRKIDAKWIEGPHVDMCPLIVEYVKQGKLGVKSGEGFYKYPGPGVFKKVEIPRELAEKVDPIRLIASTLNHGAYFVRAGVATRNDLDKIVKLGLGYPKGIFDYIDEYGADKIVNVLKQLKGRYGKPWYEPDPLLIEMAKK
jgi:enoyl-CoA hydratase/3-hydroxyacyl-CoA dehydrogenase